jgi:dolichol kinase
MTPEIAYRQEVLRKLIHLSSLWIPVAVYFLDRIHAVALFALLAVGMLAYEFVRRRDGALSALLNNMFGSILRAHEKKSFAGATWMMIGVLLVLAFPKMVAVTSLTVLVVSDTAAALVGRKYGRTKLVSGKSLEGTLAFFVSGLLCVSLVCALTGGGVVFIAGAIGVALAALAELFTQKIRLDDNISVTLACAIGMTVAEFALAV